MGTSKGYGGPATGLVPSWVDDPAPGVRPMPQSTPVPGAPTNPPGGGGAPGAPSAPGPRPTAPDTSGNGYLGGARGGFSRFARSGSRSALGGALSNYVRSGTGGSRRAARRMGASRAVGGRLLGIVRDVGRLGPAEVLRRLDLAGLAGAPAANVFLAVMEFVCPPGGAVDEAIARQAMLEAIGDLAEAGVGSFDTLGPAELSEFFLDYVARSIEVRVMADIGGRGVTLPDDAASVQRIQDQLHDFIVGCTRAELAGRLDGIGGLNDAQVDGLVNQIYEGAFELIAVAGEAEA